MRRQRRSRCRDGPDRDHARAGAERRNVGEERRDHLFTFEARSGCDQDEPRLRPGGQTRLQQVLALGREQALALAVLAVAQLADQLQLLVLGAFDHLILLMAWVSSALRFLLLE